MKGGKARCDSALMCHCLGAHDWVTRASYPSIIRRLLSASCSHNFHVHHVTPCCRKLGGITLLYS